VETFPPASEAEYRAECSRYNRFLREVVILSSTAWGGFVWDAGDVRCHPEQNCTCLGCGAPISRLLMKCEYCRRGVER
jgi:hypothetical protein